MLSFRPKGGISDSANDRDVSTSLRFARHDRTTFILSTYLVLSLKKDRLAVVTPVVEVVILPGGQGAQRASLHRETRKRGNILEFRMQVQI